MSQKSSLPQAAKAVSHVLMSDMAGSGRVGLWAGGTSALPNDSPDGTMRSRLICCPRINAVGIGQRGT
jgi:hypothetical protein